MAGTVSASFLSLSNGDMIFVLYSTLMACSVVRWWLRGCVGWRIKPSTAAKMRTRRTIPGILLYGLLKAQLEKFMEELLHGRIAMTSVFEEAGKMQLSEP